MLLASMVFAQDAPPAPPAPGQGFGPGAGTPAAPPDPAQMIANHMAANHVTQLTTLLELNSGQQGQATSIFKAEQSAVFGLMKRLLAANTALQTAVDNNDIAGITTHAYQIGSLTGQQVEAHAKADAAFYGILTPEQRAKYKQSKPVGPSFEGPAAPGSRPGANASGISSVVPDRVTGISAGSYAAL